MRDDPAFAEWEWTERFALMFRDVAAALVEADPVGLAAAGGVSDEYDAEAAQIVRLALSEATNREDILRLAGDVFAHYFGGKRYETQLRGVADVAWRRLTELNEGT